MLLYLNMYKFSLICSVLIMSLVVEAQQKDTIIELAKGNTSPTQGNYTKGAFYVSWGYNTEWFSYSTLHVVQDGLGNSYDIQNVHAHDHRGWDEFSFLTIPITIPQYNYRIGYFFNEKQDLAIEINFDHTKYIITDNQTVHVKGKLNGQNVDTNILFAEKTGFYYYLNNGANFFLINLVKRLRLYCNRNNSFAVDFLGKAGVGPLTPHVQNSLFGQPNNPQFQFGGWNTGLEATLKVTICRYAFLEFSQKADYAWYSNLEIAGGNAAQSFGTWEWILSGGINLPRFRHNPMFEDQKYR
jgi:hypothetical protein